MVQRRRRTLGKLTNGKPKKVARRKAGTGGTRKTGAATTKKVSARGTKTVSTRGTKKAGAGAAKDSAKNKRRARAVARLAAVILRLREEDGSESVDTRVQIGQRLADARGMLPPGQWMHFLSDDVGYAFRTAQRLIRLGQWAPRNEDVLRRVRSWGPTKVYHLMDAGPTLAKRLLSRQRFVLESGKRKTLNMLTSVELKKVLEAMAGAAAPKSQLRASEELDDVTKLIQRVQRDSKRLAGSVNRLAMTEPRLSEQERSDVGKVYKRLQRCSKKLETVLLEKD